MLIVFFSDTEGVIHREFIPEAQKVNAEFYVDFLIGYWRQFDESERPRYKMIEEQLPLTPMYQKDSFASELPFSASSTKKSSL